MRRTVLTTTALIAVGGLALPSSAAPPKPITKTYEATAVPSGLGMASYCDGVPTTTDKHLEPFKAPAKGTLKVVMSGVTGDWDLMLLDKGGSTLIMSAEIGTGDESYTHKISKPGDFTILSCNALGSLTASITYTFTFAK
ncbi:MAG TPA: hypothetical protein VNA14_04230 [Mycobacteriales bacterium]|nr:hypothetical protein [Mycobacteriales bacterium]